MIRSRPSPTILRASSRAGLGTLNIAWMGGQCREGIGPAICLPKPCHGPRRRGPFRRLSNFACELFHKSLSAFIENLQRPNWGSGSSLSNKRQFSYARPAAIEYLKFTNMSFR